jgi:cystathionine beta-lyase
MTTAEGSRPADSNLKAVPEKAVLAFLDAMTLHGTGVSSWGGFESLAILCDVTPCRTTTKWEPNGPSIRFHTGREEIVDLERGFTALAAAK